MARRGKKKSKFPPVKKPRVEILPGSTPLHSAIRDGNVRVVREVLKLVDDTNVKIVGGFTPLHVAVLERQLDCFHMLLRRNAKVNIADDRGRFPLHYAARNGELHMLKRLLALENTINVQDRENYSAIHIAIKHKKLDCVNELLNAGADVNICDCEGRTPLHIAIEEGCDSVIEKLLVLNANVNVQASYGRTALHFAIVKGNLDYVELLLNAGVNIDLGRSFDSSPLHYASRGDDRRIWKKLLERKPKALINKRSIFALFNTILQMKKLDYFDDLLEAGVNVSVKERATNMSLLHLAAYHENERPLKKLLQFGLDVDAQDNEGRTALHYACGSGRLNNILPLLDAGASWNIQNNEKRTMLSYLIAFMAFNPALDVQMPLLKVILERTNDGDSVNGTASLFNLLFLGWELDDHIFELIKLVLLTQKSLVGVDCSGHSIPNLITWRFMFIASEMATVTLIRICLEHGAYLDREDCDRIKMFTGVQEGVLQDVELCVQSITNEFNNYTLVKFYLYHNIFYNSSVIPIECLRITPIKGSWKITEQDVRSEIERNGYCDVSRVMSTSLSKLCIESFCGKSFTY